MLRLLQATRRTLPSSASFNSLLASSRSASSKAGAKAGAKASIKAAAAEAPPKEMLLYVGPPGQRPIINWLTGIIFFGAGLNIAYSLSTHMVWPIYSRDPEVKPELCSETTRLIAGGVTLATFSGLAFVFLIVPSRTITRITLRPHERTLVVRTAQRGTSSMWPASIMPRGIMRSFKAGGFYHTSDPRDRVVPLDAVFRSEGDAASGEATSIAGSAYRRGMALRVGGYAAQFQMESSGTIPPAHMHNAGLHTRFLRLIAYTARGTTDWSDIPQHVLPKGAKRAEVRGSAASPTKMLEERERKGRLLGPKEPWFLDRRNFDRLLPMFQHGKPQTQEQEQQQQQQQQQNKQKMK